MKLHIERPHPTNLVFGILPALCGRKKPTDYRMFPSDDAIRERARRPFFATKRRDVTCEACRRALVKMSAFERRRALAGIAP